MADTWSARTSSAFSWTEQSTVSTEEITTTYDYILLARRYLAAKDPMATALLILLQWRCNNFAEMATVIGSFHLPLPE